MKFGLIKERKTPPDRRVVFSPEKARTVQNQYPHLEFAVKSSDIRIFTDTAYEENGLEVTDDLSSCDVLLGVKEVPIEALIPKASYFSFPTLSKNNLITAIYSRLF